MYLRYIIFDAWNMGKINILSLCIFDTVINRVKYLIEKRKRQLSVKRTLQMVEEREEQRLDHRQPWDRSIHQNGLQVLRSGMLHKLRRLRQGDSLLIAWWWRTTKEMDHLSEMNRSDHESLKNIMVCYKHFEEKALHKTPTRVQMNSKMKPVSTIIPSTQETINLPPVAVMKTLKTQGNHPLQEISTKTSCWNSSRWTPSHLLMT